MQEDSKMMSESDQLVLKMVNALLTSPIAPDIPKELTGNEEVKNLYNYLINMRSIFWSFAQGNFNVDVTIKGTVGGAAKSLQANLRHLSWQVQMVANGDFTQRVDFMGEFSIAFNTMVVQFEQTLKDLTEQRELLRGMTEDLHKEIAVRLQAEEALKKSEERYRSLARLDPLTNMFNRRYFFEIATAEIDRMVRNGEGVCTVAMIDIDFFKLFNDNYGHLNGDLCLKQIADVLLKQVRRFDVLARYGGEEFIILFPQTKIEVGRNVAERIRATIENTDIVTENVTTNVTVSIGLAEIKIKDVVSKDVDKILNKAISQADLALYTAKKNDRNQVCIFEESMEEV